ncbi:Vestigial family [Trinorchestia longiramus]|nr:Vestigial family [Trinorchestia longiramus]
MVACTTSVTRAVVLAAITFACYLFQKLCSERQTPVTPVTPSHPYHPLHHHHHHHHHLLNQHHLPPHQLQHHHHQNILTTTDQSDGAVPTGNDVRYVSANCVVVTHYRGDTAAMVDEHFSRALAPAHCEKPQLNKGKSTSFTCRGLCRELRGKSVSFTCRGLRRELRGKSASFTCRGLYPSVENLMQFPALGRSVEYVFWT